MSGFAYSRSYDLPDGFTVEFTLDGLQLDCAWSPSPPKGRRAKRIRPHYRKARNDFIKSLDIPALVVEL